VVLGEPVAVVAETVDGLGESDGFVDGIGSSATFTNWALI
jgi:hypothetical protein